MHRLELCLQELSKRTGVRLHTVMKEEELLGWKPGAFSPPAGPVERPQVSWLERALNATVDTVGMDPRLADAFRSAGLRTLRAVLKLSREDLRGKIGVERLISFETWLAGNSTIAGLDDGVLHLGMTEEEMDILPGRHGRPSIGRIETPHMRGYGMPRRGV